MMSDLRYFMYNNGSEKELWALRKDGYEKCLIGNGFTLTDARERLKWHRPFDIGEESVIKMAERFHSWQEITKKEAFMMGL